MSQDWETDGEPEGRVYPFDGERAEHVVPADGDPAIEDWDAERRTQGWASGPEYRTFLLTRRMLAPRRGLRWGAIVVVLAVLVLLIVKPLVALAAIGLAVVATIVLVGILAAGTLLLAARMVLGARHR